MRIAIVDDDTEFAAFLSALLGNAGHTMIVSNNGSTFLRLVKTETFDVILLDWNLPGADGIDIVGVLRNDLALDVPIILLTARSEDEDIVSGLKAGADDFIIKPIDGNVLLARIDAVMRRRGSNRQSEPMQRYGKFLFDHAQEIVHHGDLPIQLTSKEFQLATMLFKNLGRPLSRAYLLETVWNRHPDVVTRTLDSHVARLRLKLNLRPQNGFRLSPIYSYGYRLETVDGGAEMTDTIE